MFAPTEFQSIRECCLKDFETLLENLNITPPDWSGNEYRIYEQLDDDITRKICELMKSPSIIEGYTALLELGSVPYNFSEIDNELLAKVVNNRGKILSGLDHAQKAAVEAEAKKKLAQARQKKRIRLPGFIGLGGLLIAIGLFMFGIIGGLLILLGAVSAIFGFIGKVEDEPVRQVEAVPEEKPPPFTQNELQKVLDVLAQVDKIVRAI